MGGGIQAQPPAGKPADEKLQHVGDIVERDGHGRLPLGAGELRDVLEQGAGAIKAVVVIGVHGGDDPGFGGCRIKARQRPWRCGGKLVGHLGIGARDNGHPVQDEVLCFARQRCYRSGEACCRASRGQHRIKDVDELLFKCVGGEPFFSHRRQPGIRTGRRRVH